MEKLYCTSCEKEYSRKFGKKEKVILRKDEAGKFLAVNKATGPGYGDDGRVACDCGCVTVIRIKDKPKPKKNEHRKIT